MCNESLINSNSIHWSWPEDGTARQNFERESPMDYFSKAWIHDWPVVASSYINPFFKDRSCLVSGVYNFTTSDYLLDGWCVWLYDFWIPRWTDCWRLLKLYLVCLSELNDIRYRCRRISHEYQQHLRSQSIYVWVNNWNYSESII
jgi:hypothetical protein